MHVILYKTYTSTTLFHDFLLAAVLLYLLFSYVIITVEDTLNISFTGNILNLSSAEVIFSQTESHGNAYLLTVYFDGIVHYVSSESFDVRKCLITVFSYKDKQEFLSAPSAHEGFGSADDS